jgi:nucleotide-binding universal stress UspA family protein
MAMSTAEMAGFVPVHAPEDLLTEIGKQLVERATQAAKKAGAKRVSTVLLSGDAGNAILARAKKERSHLIVLGTRGLSEIGGLLVGSVSHKVSSRSHCACLTVK